MKSDFALQNRDNKILYLYQSDASGELMNAMLFMDRIETWVIARLESDGDINSKDAVHSRLQRLSEIFKDYRDSIEPDNFDLCRLISWMTTSEQHYVLDYLDQFQPEFIRQFVHYCQRMKDNDVSASLVLERITALYRTRLLHRVFSEDNVEFVMNTLMEQ